MSALTLEAARRKLADARRDLGNDLCGWSVTDLLADNFDAPLDQCRDMAERLASTVEEK